MNTEAKPILTPNPASEAPVHLHEVPLRVLYGRRAAVELRAYAVNDDERDEPVVVIFRRRAA